MDTSGSTGTEKGRHAHTNINVGRVERKASLIGGAALALTGLTKMKNMKFVPGMAMMAAGGMLMYRGKTGHCDVYEKIGVATAGTEDAGLVVEKVLTINKSPGEVYDFWHDFGNMPRFMKHLDMVQKTGSSTSHWKARGPGDVTLEWDAEMTEDTPGQRISWQSLENADIPNKGTVEFHVAPGGRGTELSVRMQYFPVGGTVGKMAAKVAHGINSRQVEEDLRRLKQILETGETPTACMTPECTTTH